MLSLSLKLLVLNALIVWQVNAHYLSNLPLSIYDSKIVLQKWNALEDDFKDYGTNLANDFQYTIDPLKSNNVTVSNLCTVALSEMVTALREYKLWAYEMLDATGKLPSGILSFSTSELGSYEQCLRISAPMSSITENPIDGQYCLLKFILPLPEKTEKSLPLGNIFPFTNHTFKTQVFEHWKQFFRFLYSTAPTLGICLPSACTQEDTSSISKYFLKNMPINPLVVRCESNKSEMKTLDIVQLLALSMFGLFALLVLGSTVYVSIRKPVKGASNEGSIFRQEVFKSFCLFTNSRNVFDLSSSANENLSFLHGIKVISIIWVIVCHFVGHFNIDVLRDFNISEGVTRSLIFQAFSNGYLSVDSFFFASGLLITALSVERYKLKKVNPILLILMRIARLLPSAMIVMGIYLLFPLLSRGPYWNEFFPIYTHFIRANWWRLLTFTNNLVPAEKMPILHYWYIACDMQFFVVGVLFILLYFKKRVAAVAFGVFLIFASILTTAGLIYKYDVEPFTTTSIFDNKSFGRNLFIHFYPSSHLGPFVVGLLTGHFIVRNPDLKISKIKMAIGWNIAGFSCFASVFGVYWWSNGAPITLTANLLYGSFHKTTWALGLGWLSYMCATGKGGFINAILGSKLFLPLSRLTYLTYLVHFAVVIFYWSIPHGVFDSSYILIAWLVIGVTATSFGLAFCCYLLFDGPIGKLQRMFLKNKL